MIAREGEEEFFLDPNDFVSVNIMHPQPYSNLKISSEFDFDNDSDEVLPSIDEKSLTDFRVNQSKKSVKFGSQSPMMNSATTEYRVSQIKSDSWIMKGLPLNIETSSYRDHSKPNDEGKFEIEKSVLDEAYICLVFQALSEAKLSEILTVRFNMSLTDVQYLTVVHDNYVHMILILTSLSKSS